MHKHGQLHAVRRKMDTAPEVVHSMTNFCGVQHPEHQLPACGNPQASTTHLPRRCDRGGTMLKRKPRHLPLNPSSKWPSSPVEAFRQWPAAQGATQKEASRSSFHSGRAPWCEEATSNVTVRPHVKSCGGRHAFIQEAAGAAESQSYYISEFRTDRV